MYFSKCNLTTRKVAAKDKSDVTLCCVHFGPEGATVASNGRSMLAVGPVDESRLHFPPVEGEADPPPSGVSVPLDLVDTAVRNLPRDKRFSLQHVKMTRCDERKVEFTTASTTKEQRVAGRPVRERYPEYKGILRKARQMARQGRVCVSRKDLMELLGAMDEASGDADQGAVFVEFGGQEDALLLRSVNPVTGQHVVGLSMPLRTGGEWLQEDTWEQGMFPAVKRTPPRRKVI